MKIRPENISCWKCCKSFAFTIETNQEHSYRTFCPYCGEENVIDLEPHIKKDDVVFKDGSSPESQEITSNKYDLPDTLQGQKPED